MIEAMGKNIAPQKSCIEAPRVVGESKPMQRLGSVVQTIAIRDCTVMIHGESGSGKELVARQIHVQSRRKNKPFVAVDCTTLRDTLLESQLFGHVKGAFTGADKSTTGFIRAADGGTLFLDEIGDMAPAVQAKLLRVIQERVVVPVGSTEPIPVNVRVLAATHRDVRKMVRSGDFRQDLFYRLNVVRVDVPALRERRQDIPALANHFLQQLSELYQEPSRSFTKEALDLLESHDWPGNVRELTNAIEHAYVLGEGEQLGVADLPEELRASALQVNMLGGEEFPTLAMAERALLVRALHETKGNQSHAARILDVERHRFYRMLSRYELDVDTFR